MLTDTILEDFHWCRGGEQSIRCTHLCINTYQSSLCSLSCLLLSNSRFFAMGSRRCYRCDSLNWTCMLFSAHCNTQKDSEQSSGFWNANAFSIPCRITNEGPTSPSTSQSTTVSTSSRFSHTPSSGLCSRWTWPIVTSIREPASIRTTTTISSEPLSIRATTALSWIRDSVAVSPPEQ